TEAGHDVWVVSRPKRPRSTGLQARVRRTWKTLTQPPQNTATPLLDFLGDRHIVLDRFRPVEAADVPDADAVIATWWETAPSVAAFPPEKGRNAWGGFPPGRDHGIGIGHIRGLDRAKAVQHDMPVAQKIEQWCHGVLRWLGQGFPRPSDPGLQSCAAGPFRARHHPHIMPGFG
ncbi:MAG: hypothetical protein AAFR20_12290, partial [Pseudomonadota bacterium]